MINDDYNHTSNKPMIMICATICMILAILLSGRVGVEIGRKTETVSEKEEAIARVEMQDIIDEWIEFERIGNAHTYSAGIKSMLCRHVKTDYLYVINVCGDYRGMTPLLDETGKHLTYTDLFSDSAIDNK